MRGRSDSSLLRLINSRKIVDTVLAVAPLGISRAEVARATGLSKPTVSALVGDLEAAGLMRMADPGSPSGDIGRPAALYEIIPDSSLVIGADIGATKIIVGVADLLGRPMAEEMIETPSDAAAAADAVCDAALRLLEDSAGGSGRLRNACVGVPGVYRADTDSVEMALNLPGFEGLNFHAHLTDRLGVPVQIDNDVNLAAVGEADAGADQTDFAAVSIGTGIGSGLIIGGDLYRGGTGAAGELGSLILPTTDGIAGAGGRVTLEDVASAPAIRRIFDRAVRNGRSSALDGGAEVADIFSAAAAGDEAAGHALSTAAGAMADAVTHLCLINDPALIIFGGGVGANPVFVEAVAAELDGLLAHPPALAPSTLGRRATFLGAISLALRSLRESLVEQALDGREIRGARR
ncbi:MAG: ROK family transcriptional regulator [bacterium]|nr:ROK family transcriptional regulator [bacterium]MCY3952759.1 ROK family transcriptional regulator [bacterium]MCY4104262.1 ROK family transcriptional regulator [bacterium]